MKKLTPGHILLPFGVVFSLSPFASSALALILGIILVLFFGNPYEKITKSWPHKMLQLSVIGLGFGMNLEVVAVVGVSGIGYTVIGIASALLIGFLLGKWLKVNRDTSTLITVGTAICGGSAIAAVSPIIRAKHHDVSVALITVFFLNALALFIFPILGHRLGLTESQFGLWSALAIHDTSSVVGATLHYGPQALQIGTTVKLARALWIIPVAFLIGLLRKKEEHTEEVKAKKPWFILGFIIAAGLVTYIPQLSDAGETIESFAKKLMVVTLFLIGTGINRSSLKNVGPKPFILGVLLWITIGGLSLGGVLLGLIA